MRMDSLIRLVLNPFKSASNRSWRSALRRSTPSSHLLHKGGGGHTWEGAGDEVRVIGDQGAPTAAGAAHYAPLAT